MFKYTKERKENPFVKVFPCEIDIKVFSEFLSMKKYFVQSLSKLSNFKGKKTTSHYNYTNKAQTSKKNLTQKSIEKSQVL